MGNKIDYLNHVIFKFILRGEVYFVIFLESAMIFQALKHLLKICLNAMSVLIISMTMNYI